ncbi:hypothetical protein [Rhodonellum sp.]|uniref:hypothetical protein n=1 Tax=Rhodonellum sp. TaxID=2231180 RepID=UPI002715F0E3|nr:hypothetical protein [Rhodonellum sp.]MDO9554404.1 hypothetical protein [Rhodonellum sp.]
MKKQLTLLFFLLLIGFPGKSQENSGEIQKIPVFESPLEKQFFTQHLHEPFYLLQTLHSNPGLDLSRWDKLLKVLDKKEGRSRNNTQLLSDIFFKTHQHLLKRYEQHASFSNLLSSGTYDCVTGSATLGLLLDRYGIAYEVIETDYHVFLKGEFAGQDFIMESTFSEHGLIVGKDLVLEFEKKFKTKGGERKYDFNIGLGNNESLSAENQTYESIGLKELAGLQYYNDAILRFNQKNYGAAYAQLIKASFLYPSERISKLTKMMAELIGVRADSNELSFLINP